MITAPPVHPDPVLQGAIAAACESLDGMQDFLDRCSAALQAGQTAGELRGMNSDDYEALYAVALQLHEAADHERALPVALALVAHAPHTVKYCYLAGLCLQKQGRHPSAVALYLLALNENAGHAPSAFRVGECCTAVGDGEGAQRAYEHAVELARGDERYRHLQSAAMARLSQPAGQGLAGVGVPLVARSR